MLARLPTSLLLLATVAAIWQALASDNVTVYRCTDAQGAIALRDTPCDDGQTQRERTMLRPVDAAPRPPVPAASTPPPSPADTPSRPQVVVLQAPLPMYRCVRPDGSSYTSDSASGNPRWVPLWTLGYGPPRHRPSYDAGTSPPAGPGHAHRPSRGYIGGAGTWVQDDCRPIPQREVCGLLVDRREEIRRRFNAHLDNDCRA